MAKLIRTVAALAIVLALAFVLNPSPERHRAKIKQAIAERSPISGALGIGALTAFVSNYHSIGIASYTESSGKTLSYGAFGIVYVAQGN
jgi:hypothetical protein